MSLYLKRELLLYHIQHRSIYIYIIYNIIIISYSDICSNHNMGIATEIKSLAIL